MDEIFRIIQAKESEESRIDPDIIQERIAKLIWLKKKYGSMEHVFEVWQELRLEATLSVDIDGEISRLADQLKQSRILLGEKARIISKKRTAVIKSTQQHIERMLKSMGIANPTFIIKWHQIVVESLEHHEHIAIIDNTMYVAHQTGIDTIEFLISLNTGEELKPLIKAASGGEISRIMLSLKSLINQKTGIPSMVFDEIDTGISGKIARKVGGVMQELGQNKQIIAISHSPQIASLAHHHILVQKSTSDESTSVHARMLSDEERITEIATLLSGEHITQTSLNTAKELLAADEIHQGKQK
jgi:DNA repair protein RecN (Recombination protein N)